MSAYTYLLDFCAIIISGITLYDGLSTNNGMVAVYGEGYLARTLHKLDSLHSRSDFESMLRQNTRIQPQIQKFYKGPIYARLCLTEREGIKGLEYYLMSLGFRASDHKKVIDAGQLYLDRSETINSPSRTGQSETKTMKYNPHLGRELISAISINQVSLQGIYYCAASAGHFGQYNLQADSPPDLGTIIFKSSVKLAGIKKGLVYINGSLRILTSNLNPEDIFELPIWEPHPKFDTSVNNGFIKRDILDAFFYLYYNYEGVNVQDNEQQHVLLGCFEKI